MNVCRTCGIMLLFVRNSDFERGRWREIGRTWARGENNGWSRMSGIVDVIMCLTQNVRRRVRTGDASRKFGACDGVQ